MKAFQLKIAIKKSKPPIWRRVIVPTGITFSQLSMILNEVMGWSGYHMFEFEFYHRELVIIEDAEEYDGDGPFDHLEASTTLIREFMEENDWFTYTYDFGDDWQHRVTIEKIIENWELDYPQVIKYKGDCPMEDGGGILENPNHYDVEYVNQLLEQNYHYVWGKRENRFQGEIYEDHFSGKYGLKATKRDKNTNLNILRSGRHRMEDSMQNMADLIMQFIEEQKKNEKEIQSLPSLKCIFEDFEKEDLLEIAEEKGVFCPSSYNKKQIINKLYDFMMNEKEIEKYFYCMSNKEREEFEKAIACNGIYESENSGYLINLYKGAYIGILEDGGVMIPEDVKQAYAAFSNTFLETEAEKRYYICCCMETAGLLYGIVPFDIFQKVVNVCEKYTLTADKIKSIIAQIPVEYKNCVVKNNKIFRKEYYPNDRGLLSAQGNKKYYIPTEEEIIDIGSNGYPSQDMNLKKFQQYMRNKLGALEEEAEFGGHIIWQLISVDCEMQEIFEVLDDLGLMVDSEKELHMLIQQVNQLWNNTRKMVNRGYTPMEMRNMKTPVLTKKSFNDNIIDIRAVRKDKLYPNDPCPCGSGKKYKNCCKNRNKNS